MFAAYSWSSFFEFTGIVLVCYYCILWVTCYRQEINHFLFRKRRLLKDAVEAPVKRPDLLPRVHELISELGLVIRKAGENHPPIPELLFALQSCIKDFLLLEATEYKGKINLYIEQELEIHGVQGITMEEIENLWNA